MPIGSNFVGAGYAHTWLDISDSPALQLQNVKAELNTWAGSYIRSFELLGQTARVDVAQPYHEGTWTGEIAGAPASAHRAGFGDTIGRFSVNLYGAPPLAGRDFAGYRASLSGETIVGAAVAVHVPTGEYKEDKLINLGSNRFTLRPQIGVVHSWSNWSAEITGTAWIFTDNTSFFRGRTLENDPLYTMQTHLIYTFRPGLWTGIGALYGYGSQSTVNGRTADDRKELVAWSVSVGYPISHDWGVKLAYIGTRKLSLTGNDTDSALLGVAYYW